MNPLSTLKMDLNFVLLFGEKTTIRKQKNGISYLGTIDENYVDWNNTIVLNIYLTFA